METTLAQQLDALSRAALTPSPRTWIVGDLTEEQVRFLRRNDTEAADAVDSLFDAIETGMIHPATSALDLTVEQLLAEEGA